ncbi:VOC family protein [Variovorax sp. GB1P17]|uniref:VOC family protein n=1 Tax=Variovorax sp. GB1P17 TaxID=3443740 RepID=UPI003F47B8D7
MPDQTAAAAVIYAKDVTRVGAFYAKVAGLTLSPPEPDHASLASPALQLFIVAMNPGIAAKVQIAQPPVLRENTALKFIFPVASLADARRLAAESGGALKPAEAEWEFNGHRHCDGHDPEGNVFQLRERVA